MKEPKIMTAIAAAILAVTLSAMLAGCGAGADADGPYMTCSGSASPKACTVTMDDGRRVQCVVLDGSAYRSGISCDWAHADGADNQDGRDGQ